MKIPLPVKTVGHWNSVTVEELIKALETMPKDKIVRTEGCDCYGEITNIELDNNVVYLNRN